MLLQYSSWKHIIEWYTHNFLNKKNVILLVDVDDTLIKCTSYLGSTEWFDDQASKTRHFHLLVKKWVELLPTLDFELCDNKIPEFINNLNGEVIAITSRHCAVQVNTLKNLKDNDIQIQNIISCGLFQKSRMVENYVQPDSDTFTYIFIDDKKNHILDMHRNFPNIHCIWLNEKMNLFSYLKFNLLHR